jgi:Undecaprenyl-phosphate galactose phosphotransferase WbaP
MSSSAERHSVMPAMPIDLAAAVAASRPNLVSALTICADLLGITFAAAGAIAVRWLTGGSFRLDQLLAWWPLPILVILFVAQARGYARTPPHPAEELRRLSTATTLAFAMLVTATFFLRSFEAYSRVAVLVALGFSWITVPTARAIMRGWGTRYAWWGVPVVVVGAGMTAQGVIQSLQRWPSRGLRPIVALDDNTDKQGTLISGIPVVGPLEPAALAAAQAGVTTLLVAMPGAPPERVRALWRRLGPHFPSVLVVPGLGEFASLWVEAKDIGGQVALELRQSLLRPSRRFLKRTLDLILVLLLLIGLSPLLLGLMVLVYVTSPGPIFYGQQRLGRNARTFKAWKFRTMRRDADALLARLLASDPRLRAEWDRDHKLRVDPRVTMIGRFLRKTSLDELPQLWNVVNGEMSLVGPRPVTQGEIGKYGEQWELYKRVRPGITGQWQVSGRNHTTYEERVAWDAFYVHNWSPWLDFVILARTVQTVVRGEGAY